VPLIATYENRHVLVSTTYSKSALRVVADAVSRNISGVDYFPSYEIIAGPQSRGRFFANDLRTVTPEGVEAVMDVFARHYLTDAPQGGIRLWLLGRSSLSKSSGNTRRSATKKCSMTERLVVLGNCQAAPFAKCLRALNPSFDVKVVTLSRCKGKDAQERAATKLKNADVIFRQPGSEGALPLAGIESLSASFSNLVSYPKLTFYGFHPDFCFLRYPGGALVRSGCGPYHSVLAAAAFANGLTEERALQLFNSYFFARLGYLDRFAPWKDLLLSKTQEIGYDLHEDFQDWLRQGAFMHTWQHPTVRVIASVAVRAMAKANLRQTVDDPHDVPDALARATALPVFPEIARAVGVAPITGFRRVVRKNKVHDVSLAEFVRGTYEIYRKVDRAVFETGKIAAARSVLSSEVLH
jgi:hypothetical protein